MNFSKKWLSLSLVAVTLIILVLLSSGISNIEFQLGRPFFLRRGGNESQDLSDLNFRMWRISGLWEVLGALILWVLLPISIIHFIVSPEARKRTIRHVIRLSIISYALIIILRQCGKINSDNFPNLGELINPPPESQLGEDFGSVINFEPSSLIIFLASLIIAGVLVIGIWIIWRTLRPKPAIEQLGREAQDAISKMKAGEEVTDTILACYIEMNRILRDQKGISREAYLTPREFELKLKEFGLPPSSIETLTRLFEQARYGRIQFQSSQHQEALSCLNEIVQASNSPS